MIRLFSISALAIMLTGFFLIPAVSADDMSCWIEAGDADAYLTVWDLDADGNQLAKIWEGLIEQGTRKKMMTSNGRIRYFTNIGSQSSSAGVDGTCRNAETISVP